MSDASTDNAAARIAELETAVQLLPGRANRMERNRINKELALLRGACLPPTAAPIVHAALPAACAGSLAVAAHWEALRPNMPIGPPSCVRCGDGTSAICTFHPDAKAFAFGSGRFDYGYTSLWDTPHDGWMCCNGAGPECPGCMQEPTHSMDPEWWVPYAVLAPALPAGEDTASSEQGDSDQEDASSSFDSMSIDSD